MPNGTSTCTNPSLCGAGVKQGQGLSFTLPYATGINWIESEMTQLKSNASAVGIQLSLQPKPFNQVTAIGGGGLRRHACVLCLGLRQLGRRLDVRARLRADR